MRAELARPFQQRIEEDPREASGHREAHRQAPELGAPARHARRRQPLHRGVPRRVAAACGRCCIRAAAASATRSARYFIELAKTDAEKITLSACRTATSPISREGAPHFDDYVEAVGWAQDYARANREEMMDLVLDALHRHLPAFDVTGGGGQLPPQLRRARDALRRAGLAHAQGRDPRARGRARHHPRQHGRAQLHRARQGLGRELPFLRARRRAPDEPERRAEEIFRRRTWKTQTQGVICRKDKGVLDEIPGAYKNIDEVMANQSDLVEVVHTLKQVLCVKG